MARGVEASDGSRERRSVPGSPHLVSFAEMPPDMGKLIVCGLLLALTTLNRTKM